MSVLDPSPVAAVAALVCSLAAGAGLLWLWLSTAPRRVRPAGETMELRDETPALVDLLTGGFEVEDDAVTATAVDLAHRGYYTFEEYGGKLEIRLRTGPSGEPARPHSGIARANPPSSRWVRSSDRSGAPRGAARAL